MNWTLKFKDGTVKHVREGQRYSFGKDQSNDYPIDDLTVSRQHCSLIRSRGSSFVMLDDTSSNGTFVNGDKVMKQKKELKWGDKVELLGDFGPGSNSKTRRTVCNDLLAFCARLNCSR